MTTIKALPEEILYMIFDELDPESYDVAYCQHVCKAWYIPAHITLLKDVSLFTQESIEQFIRSIDHNPDPLYLKAVKTISLDTLDDFDWDIRFDKATIRKVLHRFPNLGWATFTDGLTFLHDFDDDLCIELLKCCPKLDNFRVYRSPFARSHYSFEEYNTILQKVRLLVTRLDLDTIRSPPNGMVNFLTSFPRLKVIDGLTDMFDTLADWLPILEKLDNVQEFSIKPTRDDVEKFAEKYLVQKTEPIKQLMIRRFANIKTLTIENRPSFPLNSYKFVAKYLTGLKTFHIMSDLDKEWTDIKQRMFCDIVVDFGRFLDTCHANLSMRPEVMSEYLPLVIYKVFNQSPTDNTSRIFVLRMLDDHNVNQAVLNIDTVKEDRVRKVEVVFRNEYSAVKVAKFLQKASDFDNVDEFRFVIPQRDTTGYKIDITSYERLMSKMTSLKKVVLDVPESFKRTEAAWNSTFPLVEQVTFQASMDGKFQSLLDKSFAAFPNLKHLKLHYFSGIWHPFCGEFRVDLGQYKLKRLTLDVTPVQRKMEDKSEDEEVDEDKDFFVVVVEFLKSSKRQIYKVYFSLASVERIYDEDLEAFNRGESYLRVHITLTSLEVLVLCKTQTGRGFARENYLEEHYSDSLSRTIINLE